MMDEQTIYYAITGVGQNPSDPSGLVRRKFTDKGRLDEALHVDMTWQRDTAIIEWEYGNMVGELVQISEADALELIERFREKWSREG
jgi:hypothetical protein